MNTTSLRTNNLNTAFMRKLFSFIVFFQFALDSKSQLGVRYDPAIQPITGMQYFKPVGNLFVGDCIPFFRDSTYYLYWLLDSAHHKSLNGLGGHHWALSTSAD